MTSQPRLWAHRVRWRLLGWWQWPAFLVFTVGDGLILHLLPPIGLLEASHFRARIVFWMLVAAFGNLVLMGGVAPWIARRLAARADHGAEAALAPGVARATEPSPGRPDAAMRSAGPPYEVLLDRTALALLAAGALGVLAAGLGSQPLIVSETEATEANARAVREYVLANGTQEERRNLDTANAHPVGEGLFRTCLAHDDRRGASCFYVDTKTRPPRLRRDPSATTNQELFEPSGRR